MRMLLFLLFAGIFGMVSHISGATDITVVKDSSQKASGPYSQAVIANGFLFASGVIARDPKSGKLAGDTIEVQTRQAFANIRSVLAAGGASLDDVVKVTVFLKNPGDFPKMNRVYASIFKTYRPARTTVPGVEWGPGILIEVDVVAVIAKDHKDK